MVDENHVPHLDVLKRQVADGRMNRREFVRLATLLGLAAPAAYALLGERAAVAAQDMAIPQGGTLRIGTRVKDLKNPHTYSWGAYDSNIARQVVE